MSGNPNPPTTKNNVYIVLSLLDRSNCKNDDIIDSILFLQKNPRISPISSIERIHCIFCIVFFKNSIEFF